MSDFNNELLRLNEMKEKGLISQEEFEAAKAKLLSDSANPPNESPAPPELPESATVVMAVVPPAPPSAPPPATPSPSAASMDIPPGIAGWSWGAFLWNWIWAIFNNTWIGLLALIPGVNIVMIFVLGAKGREWAWKNKKWDSVEHFNRVQRKWSVWGIGLVLASLLLSGLLVIGSMYFLASESSKFSGFNVPPGTGTSETIAAPEVPMTAESVTPDTGTPAIAEDTAPTEMIAQDALTEEAIAGNAIVEDTVAQDAAAALNKKHQEELAKTRTEAAAAKAEAAKAKKEALKAEKALAEQRRLQEEQRMAQELAEQEQVPCPYTRAQPLTCSSRQGQPAYCDWNFKACGMPRLLKKESKTTCDGKMRTDPENNQIEVVDGCRGKFIPEN